MGLGEGPLELPAVVLEGLLGLLQRDVAAADQRLGVQLPDRALAVDDVVHQRLGHRRVVALVVPAAAVADQVDDDVLLERLPVVDGQPRHPDAGLGVVAVHVEDRRADHPRDVGRVEARPGRRRAGGEADLVVDDDVHRAAGAVAAQLRQVQGLRRRRPGRRTRSRRAAGPGSTVKPCSPLSIMSCLARTMPSSTGLTVSRWLGLLASETAISASGRNGLLKVPGRRRGGTSRRRSPGRVPGSMLPSNSPKIFA